MRTATIRFTFALMIAFIPIGMQGALAEDGDWLDERTKFWNDKGRIGGQIRLRGESFNDFDFNDDVETDGRDDDFLLSRIRLSLDLNPSELLRLYIEIQDSHQFETDTPKAFRVGGTAREDRLDIYQAFVDVRPIPAVPLTVRVGRHELSYGNQRLVGAFGWSNVGRSFQGVKARFETEAFFADTFFANVIVPEDRHFNDEEHDDDFYGVYGGWKEFPTGVIEGYFLARDNEITGLHTYTFGTRLAGHLLDSQAVDYAVELAIQTGDAPAGRDQEAFAAHAGGGYTFKKCAATPRLGIEYNYSTGDDDPADGKNETFDNLFPTNHLHYGYMDLFSWRNLHNLRLSASAKPIEKLTLKCDVHFFWLDEAADGWRSASGAVIRPGKAGADDFVGEEIDLTLSYAFNNHLSFQAGYSHFFPGEFVDETGPDDDADWVYLQTTFTF